MERLKHAESKDRSGSCCRPIRRVVSAFGQTTSTTAIYTTTSTLPPVGLASSETAQVNVVNTANVSIATLGAVPALPSCTGSIAFLNASGNMIGKATTFTVGSGQIFSATLPYASAGASGSRTVIRAEIVSTITVGGMAMLGIVTEPAMPAAPACALQSSFETYDTATGVTHVFISGPAAAQILTPAIRSGNFTATLPN
jgi:hypothetical protein